MLELKQILMVGIGGAVGSIARFKLGGFILQRWPAWNFPLSTLSINLLGCLVIGTLAALVERHDLFSPPARLLLFTGLLGGFTTFSAFAYEGVFLFRRGAVNLAVAYAFLSVVGGFLAVWLGMRLVILLWPAAH